MAETPMDRLLEVRRQLNEYDSIPEYQWDRQRLHALVTERSRLELEVYGHPRKRIQLKHRLYRAGVPFHNEATMADLRKLVALLGSAGEA